MFFIINCTSSFWGFNSWLYMMLVCFFVLYMHFKVCSKCTVCYKCTSILLVHIFIAINQSVKIMSQILCKCHCRYVLKFVYVTIIKCNIVVSILTLLQNFEFQFCYSMFISFEFIFIYLFGEKGVGREFISTCIRYNLRLMRYIDIVAKHWIPVLFCYSKSVSLYFFDFLFSCFILNMG